MSGGYRVDLDALDAHTLRVDELAGRLRVAGMAGRPLDLTAYGIVGQVFAAAAAVAADSGSSAVARLAARSTGQVASIRATGRDYRLQERCVAAALRDAAIGGPR